MSFWSALPRPFFALAPLEDVTDAAFRRLVAQFGKPDVMFTEFTSADGLMLADESGQKKLRKKLVYGESERPIVAQLFTASPEYMEKGAKLVADLGFDGVDINMGCPVNEVVNNDCGAALIKNPTLARELIRAAKRGVCCCASKACTTENCIPVSVKTRIGYDKDELERWLPELLAEEPDAITIHARTRKEMSDVPAHWDRVARAVEIRDHFKSSTLIVGNGDVRDIEDAAQKVEATRCDGAMLGRAIFGNPWLFANANNPERNRGVCISPSDKIDALIHHLELFDELLTGTANYAVMKKHFKSYISGWDGAKDLRVRLMETESSKKAKEILEHSRTFQNQFARV